MVSQKGNSDSNTNDRRDEKQMKSMSSFKRDLSVPSEPKQSVKESNSDCKRGKDSETQSRLMTSRENLQLSGSTSPIRKSQHNPNDIKSELSMSLQDKKVATGLSQNKDNKSPSRTSKERIGQGQNNLQEMLINQETQQQNKKKLLINSSEVSINEQEDDAGGGTPAKVGENGHFYLSPDINNSIEGQKAKFYKTTQTHLTIGRVNSSEIKKYDG